jgi:hypothetical protein
MLIRHKYITNSSCSGFIAWGVLISNKQYYGLPADSHARIGSEDGKVIIQHASDDTCIVGIFDSLHHQSLHDPDSISSGIYSVGKAINGEWQMMPIVNIGHYIKEPKDYDDWEKSLRSFLKKNGLFNLNTYEPKWLYVRRYE